MLTPLSPFTRPVYVMAKPAGSACNLRCRYCYYQDKLPLTKMPDNILEAYIQQYIECQTGDDVLFTWHGGEPTLRGLEFYKKVVRLQRRYAGHRHVDNALQTNGTLLTPEWCRFLHQQQWLVGISIDGPAALHDVYRLDAQDRPTHARIMEAIAMLDYYGVEWNAMATVNAVTAQHPLEFYHFFKEIGCKYLQFTPVVEPLEPQSLTGQPTECAVAPYCVTPEAWGTFLCTIYDEWVRHDVGEVFVQLFDATLSNWVGVLPGVCTMAELCGHAAVIEADGSVYSCDHFVFPEHRLGNILETPLATLLYDERQQRFGLTKRNTLTRQCRACPWLFACHGDCPRVRLARSEDGEAGHNYLCAGYRRFFAHVAPTMDFMRDAYLAGESPATVMQR